MFKPIKKKKSTLNGWPKVFKKSFTGLGMDDPVRLIIIAAATEMRSTLVANLYRNPVRPHFAIFLIGFTLLVTPASSRADVAIMEICDLGFRVLPPTGPGVVGL